MLREHGRKRDDTLWHRGNRSEVAKESSPDPFKFAQVFDGRKHRARGLWNRESVYYDRIFAADQAGRKRDVFRALEGAATIAVAKTSREKFEREAVTSAIPVSGVGPTFKDYAHRYLSEVSATKRHGTQRKLALA